MGRGPSSTKENSPHSRTWGGLMQLECAERGENESYGETRGFQHAICADLSKCSHLTLFPVEEEWVMLVGSD